MESCIRCDAMGGGATRQSFELSGKVSTARKTLWAANSFMFVSLAGIFAFLGSFFPWFLLLTILFGAIGIVAAIYLFRLPRTARGQLVYDGDVLESPGAFSAKRIEISSIDYINEIYIEGGFFRNQGIHVRYKRCKEAFLALDNPGEVLGILEEEHPEIAQKRGSIGTLVEPEKPSAAKLVIIAVALIGVIPFTVLAMSMNYNVDNVVVPCRMATGDVWLFNVSDGSSWSYANFQLGPDYKTKTGLIGGNTLGCDPTQISPDSLKALVNGMTECLELGTSDDGTTTLRVCDDMDGTYTYRYAFSKGKIIPESGTLRPNGFILRNLIMLGYLFLCLLLAAFYKAAVYVTQRLKGTAGYAKRTTVDGD